MRSEKARGFVLDFADVEALNNELEPADAMAVIVALSRYAKEGRRPEKGELCPAASMAFTLMVRNVDRGLENLKKRTESTRNAANARWHPQSTAGKQMNADGCECMQTQGAEALNMQTDSDGCGCTHIESDKELEKEREEDISSKDETSSLPPPSGETEKGLLEQIAINREIEEAGRKAGIFREDWDTTSPDARDEHEDFMLMLEFPKAWVLEAIEKARRAHKQTSRYVLGILRTYRKQGGSDDDIAPADHRARGKPSNQAAPPICETKDGKDYYEGYECL